MALGHLSTLLEDVEELVREMTEEETAPTEAALQAAMTLARGLSSREPPPPELRRPRVSSLGEGDLLLEWRSRSRSILLFILPTGSTRVQHVEGTGSTVAATEVGRNISPESLVQSLEWLASPEPRS